MEVIILIALIFVILNLANKYLKVPKDDNQRYDGINNRFYGEGYTGNAPAPPTNDEDQEGRREDLQDDQADEGIEAGEDEIEAGDQADEGIEAGEDEIEAGDQADEGIEAGEDEVEAGDQADDDSGETGEAGQPEYEPASNMVDRSENRQPDSTDAGGAAKEAPAGNAAIYGNIGNAPGVVIDTEVHIDATMPQDPGKS